MLVFLGLFLGFLAFGQSSSKYFPRKRFLASDAKTLPLRMFALFPMVVTPRAICAVMNWTQDFVFVAIYQGTPGAFSALTEIAIMTGAFRVRERQNMRHELLQPKWKIAK